MISPRHILRQTLQRAGLEVHRFIPKSSPQAQVLAILNNACIDLVLDVGANKGQFSQEIRTAGYAGRIVSFEPLPNPYEELEEISRRDPLWNLHPRCALGATDGEIDINVAGNSLSSSVLPMLDVHRAVAPESAYLGKETVPLCKLDSVATEYLAAAKNVFLKIDTQGYESQVLDGARETLPGIAGIMLELSLVPLYEGQTLWLDMVKRLIDEGFALWAIQQVLIAPDTGQTLQVDGIFLRQGAHAARTR